MHRGPSQLSIIRSSRSKERDKPTNPVSPAPAAQPSSIPNSPTLSLPSTTGTPGHLIHSTSKDSLAASTPMISPKRFSSQTFLNGQLSTSERVQQRLVLLNSIRTAPVTPPVSRVRRSLPAKSESPASAISQE